MYSDTLDVLDPEGEGDENINLEYEDPGKYPIEAAPLSGQI